MGMRFNIMMRLYEKTILICLMVISCLFPVVNADAELVERIVATVNDEVILLSEYKAVMLHAKDSGKEVTPEEVIDGMIDKHLLLEQARKFSFVRDAAAGPSTTENIIDIYIDKRIRALLYIPFRDIETYYYINYERYDDKELYNVKSEIEEYLLNRMLQIKILEHIDELRENARIRVQLD